MRKKASTTTPGKKTDPASGVMKYLDCNIRHITPQDIGLLYTFGMLHARPHPYGATLCVPPEQTDDKARKFLAKAHFSKAMIELVLLAKARGCSLINIDSKGTYHPQLPDMTDKWDGTLTRKAPPARSTPAPKQ